MEEQQSFEHKMTNIYHTNHILDQLERKMNSYFSKPADPVPKLNPSQ